MIERIVVLLKRFYSKVNASLYMLRCSNRSYFARCTVILITSRDFAILLLYRCLRHSHTEHELRTIFHHFNFFKSDRNVSDCTFWKFFYKWKFSFLLMSCTRNQHSTVIESYIERDDVIRCELDSAFTERIDSLFDFHRSLSRRLWWAFTNHYREDSDRLSQITVAKALINSHRFLSRRRW
jgi:hypothetical protein